MTRRKRWILGLLAGSAILVCPWVARATEIVFDPTNYADAVQQLEQEVQAVEALKTQIQNQLKGLQNWGFTQIGSIMQSMNRWQGVLAQDSSIYGTTDPGNQLNSQFPDNPDAYASTSDAQMADRQQTWNTNQRDALVENREVQNQVVQDMEPTAQRMQAYVQKSNSAPGVTAAVQAGNEEVATVVAQVQALEALEITDSRTDAQSEAQLQAEDAYGTEEGRKVLRGMYQHERSTSAVSNIFPHAND